MTNEKNQIKDRLVLHKKDIIYLIFVIVLFWGCCFSGTDFMDTMLAFTLILWIVVLFLFILVSGFVVLYSLFLVAAEISLLIYLADSYCALPNRLPANDSALKSILAIGFIYVTMRFYIFLRETWNENNKNVRNKKGMIHEKLFNAVFLLFIFYIIWLIGMVMSPIVNNICVFKQ
jgi:hypothetical protein